MAKTLDEVIKAWEFCPKSDSCAGCPYELEFIDDAWCYKDDALQYLKLYQIKRDELYDLIEEYRREVKGKNDPLTWDELRKMLDQPIWLEEREMCDDPFAGNWRLIDCFEMWMGDKDTERMRVTGSEGESYPVYPRDMGEYWQAFRKERQEKEDE